MGEYVKKPRVIVYFNDEAEAEMVREAARFLGLTPTSWLRMKALEAVRAQTAQAPTHCEDKGCVLPGHGRITDGVVQYVRNADGTREVYVAPVGFKAVDPAYVPLGKSAVEGHDCAALDPSQCPCGETLSAADVDPADEEKPLPPSD